jgi:hypothetical protein
MRIACGGIIFAVKAIQLTCKKVMVSGSEFFYTKKRDAFNSQLHQLTKFVSREAKYILALSFKITGPFLVALVSNPGRRPALQQRRP